MEKYTFRKSIILPESMRVEIPGIQHIRLINAVNQKGDTVVCTVIPRYGL